VRLGGTGTFWAAGHGGQYIYVVPGHDLVIVMTADPYSAEAKLSPGMDALIRDIVSTVVRP
jgi:CubicO group peptidase (beta-lactamase class C family)